MNTNSSLFGRIKNAVYNAFERSGHERTRQYLLSLSDRTLEDAGFSRELLEQGIKAWPWRVAEEPLGAIKFPAVKREAKTVGDAQFSRPGFNAKLAA